MIRATAGLFLCAACCAYGQSADTPPAFEVASVKPSAKGEMVDMLDTSIVGWMRGGPGSSDPGQISFTNASLRSIILSSYGVKRSLILGRDWLAAACFNILAKVPPNASKEQVKLMLQNLLAERFELALHREKRELPSTRW